MAQVYTDILSISTTTKNENAPYLKYNQRNKIEKDKITFTISCDVPDTYETTFSIKETEIKATFKITVNKKQKQK